MPKIIENVKEKLLIEARKQVMEQGYSAMTIRSVAKACGVGVGTVYNYFDSKDMLVASFMLTDWLRCMRNIQQFCEEEKQPPEVLKCVYDELEYFIHQYKILFQDKSAGANFSAVVSQRHGLLRSQIAEPLRGICEKQKKANTEFLSEFVAESMLTWTVAGRNFEEISSILLQLF